MATYRCVICTPTAKLFDADVHYAKVPSEEGYFGVLPGHETLVGLMGEGGICRVNLDEAGTQKKEFLLFKGAVQMLNGILTVLGAQGCDPEAIVKEDVEAEKAELLSYIDSLKKKDDVQDKTRISILKRNIEWCDFQLAFLDGKVA